MTRKSRQPIKTYGIQQTENKNITVDKLPEFSRANKYIGEYNVYVKNNEVPDGTRCTIFAFSVKTGQGELKNNVSIVKEGTARFEDLRFIGKSGRGTRFDIYFKFDTSPEVVVTYKYAIKVTVDGPRPPRTTKNDINNESLSSTPSSVSKRKSESMDSSVDEFERCTTISKIIKLEEDNSSNNKTRRESVSSSKSPESLSISSSYPSSPQSSLLNYSESFSVNHNFLADTSNKNISAFNSWSMHYPTLDMSQFYSCRDFLNAYTSQLDEYNSEVFQNYFWYAVQYYMLKQKMNLN